MTVEELIARLEAMPKKAEALMMTQWGEIEVNAVEYEDTNLDGSPTSTVVISH